jgi:V/A-type H+-transporting ATPase subunit D
MAQKINPTRMELIRLKTKLKVAKRGHKLLKEKRDGLMKEFMAIIRQAKEMRERVEEKMAEGFYAFLVAAAVMRSEVLEENLLWPSKKIKLSVKTKNVMSVITPEFSYQEEGEVICYSLSTSSSGLDTSLKIFSDSLSDIVKLSQIEHSARLLAAEIEKTRRRVNALEYVFIPEMQRNIKNISTKLDEQERSALVSLMRVKQSVS